MINIKDILMRNNKNFNSFKSIMINDWIIKGSTYDENILLIFVSKCTGQTIIRHFIDEDESCKYINFVTTRNAKLIL